ncbi:CPBP family intramembrane metalloprotease [Nesterenkonia sp. E16_7]|nr:CPBP family intramembrane metalloprotease [Nesterenkonia sp. E16_10]MBO0598219.1 CPBP family intramembrane metalloprotease [Nesterenkonia sp. E16_7]
MAPDDLRNILVFLVVTFGLAWLIALPLWTGEGLASPWFLVVSIGMMLTPTIGALLVVFILERPAQKARALGLWPMTPVKRFLGYLALGLVVPIVLVLAALPIGALLGVYPADFVNFSGFEEQLEAQLGAAGAPDLPFSLGTLVALQLLTIPLGALLNLAPAMGEELGWRGWLLPKLMPLGTVPALLISGIIWGLWHAPLVLLGYNYASGPGWLGLSMMTGMCIIVGAVFGWLRLRSESVWPAALAHGSFNAAAGSYLLFSMAGEHIDTTQATILGWTGWILPLALVGVLLLTGSFSPVRQQPESQARQSTEDRELHASE